MAAAPSGETTTDYTLWIAGGAAALFALRGLRADGDDDDEGDDDAQLSDEERRRRALLILGGVVALLVLGNRDALRPHLPSLSPLVVSNYAREFGASPTVASACAVAAHVLLGLRAE